MLGHVLMVTAIYSVSISRLRIIYYTNGYMQCVQDRMLPIDMDYLKWLVSEGDFVSDDMQRVVFYTDTTKDTYLSVFHVEGDEWHMSWHVDGIMLKSKSTRYRGEFEVYITEFFREHGAKQCTTQY